VVYCVLWAVIKQLQLNDRGGPLISLSRKNNKQHIHFVQNTPKKKIDFSTKKQINASGESDLEYGLSS